MVAALLFTAVSCSKDDEGDGIDVPSTSLDVIVTADSFVSGDGSLSVPAELKAGDKMGIFAVEDGIILNDIVNVCFTAADDGNGGLVWKSEEEVMFSSGSEYYAYMPYQETLTTAPDPSAGDAAGFFAPMAEAWAVREDQSTAESYCASDMMTGSGTVGEDGMSINLSHRMSLLLVEIPVTHYTFTNTERTIPDYTVTGEVGFDGVQPYIDGDSYARFIVNPCSPLTIKATYLSTSGDEAEWEFVTDYSEGTLYHDVIGSGRRSVEHNLQVGDFFCADGNIISKDADGSLIASSNVVGMVFQTDPSRFGQRETEALDGEIRALVFSTRMSGGSKEPAHRWYMDYETETCDRDESEIGLASIRAEGDYTQSFLNADADLSGLHNTEAIITARAEDVAAGEYPSFELAYNFIQEVGGPFENVRTTGWFLPSSGQVFDILRAFTGLTLDEGTDGFAGYNTDEFYWLFDQGIDAVQLLNEAMVKVGTDNKDLFETGWGLWSSTQAESDKACNIGLGAAGFIDCIFEYKENGGRVRPVLAF